MAGTFRTSGLLEEQIAQAWRTELRANTWWPFTQVDLLAYEGTPRADGRPDLVLSRDGKPVAVGEFKFVGRSGELQALNQVLKCAQSLEVRWAFVVSRTNIVVLDRDRSHSATAAVVANVDLTADGALDPSALSKSAVAGIRALAAYVVAGQQATPWEAMYTTQYRDEQAKVAFRITVIPTQPPDGAIRLAREHAREREAREFSADRIGEAVESLVRAGLAGTNVRGGDLNPLASNGSGRDLERELSLQLLQLKLVPFEASPLRLRSLSELVATSPDKGVRYAPYVILISLGDAARGPEQAVVIAVATGLVVVEVLRNWGFSLGKGGGGTGD